MTNGTPPFSLLLWSPLRVSLSAFCTSKCCFQIHPNRFHLACKHFTQTYTFSLFLPPRAFQEGYKIPMTVTGRRFISVSALSPQTFRQNEGPAACSLQAASPFWMLEYFKKCPSALLAHFIGTGTGSGTLWFWPAWGC